MRRTTKILFCLTLILVLATVFSACKFIEAWNAAPTHIDESGDEDKDGNGDIPTPKPPPTENTQTIKNFPYEQGTLRIDFLNIGQGDSIFIIFPDGKTMLIDGGYTVFGNASAILNTLEYYKIKEIDYLMLTHPHADHCNQLPPVLQKHFVKEFFVPLLLPSYGMKDAKQLKGHFHTSEYYEFYQEMLIQEENGAVVNYNVDTFSIVGEDYSFDFYCFPEEEYQKLSGKSSNDEVNASSTIGFLTYRQARYAFTGDSNYINEEYFISNFVNDDNKHLFSSTLLKVPHHGSMTSTTQEFLDVLQPKASVICVGSNIFGHPTQPVLHRLKSIGSTIFTTKAHGQISVTQNKDKMIFNLSVPDSDKAIHDRFVIDLSTTSIEELSYQLLLYLVPTNRQEHYMHITTYSST